MPLSDILWVSKFWHVSTDQSFPWLFRLRYLINPLKLLFLNLVQIEFLSLISQRPNRSPFAKLWDTLLPLPSILQCDGTLLSMRALPLLWVIPLPYGWTAHFPTCFFFFLTQELLWIKCNMCCLLKRSEWFRITLIFFIPYRNDSRKTCLQGCKLNIGCVSVSHGFLIWMDQFWILWGKILLKTSHL